MLGIGMVLGMGREVELRLKGLSQAKGFGFTLSKANTA